MKKFKLPRKKKKQYLKDLLGKFYYENNKKLRELTLKYKYNKYEWEWYYHKRKVEVRTTEVTLETGMTLVDYYEKYYPNDKLAIHWSKQNLHKWDIFNESR